MINVQSTHNEIALSVVDNQNNNNDNGNKSSKIDNIIVDNINFSTPFNAVTGSGSCFQATIDQSYNNQLVESIIKLRHLQFSLLLTDIDRH